VASAPQVCGLLLLPDRTDALRAVSFTIGKIRRRYGLDAVQIAASLKQDDGKAPIPDTIRRAEREENLLSFDLIAQIAYLYNDCAEPIRRLLEPAGAAEPTTLEQRLQRAEQEILAVRRELAA
jgi:hypothetical protein